MSTAAAERMRECQAVILPHEFDWLEALAESHRGESAFILDAGANRGQYASAVSAVFGQLATVWSFEPNPKCWHELSRFCDGMHPFGLADVDGTIIFYTSIDGPDIEGSAFRRTDRGEGALFENEWKIRRLDGLSTPPRIDLFKLDVDGWELAALRGAEHTLSKVDAVQFEHHWDGPFLQEPSRLGDIVELLRRHGFKRFAIPDAPDTIIDEIRDQSGCTNILAVKRRSPLWELAT